jgi:branched-chain amino acid transport system ATP-binding protein
MLSLTDVSAGYGWASAIHQIDLEVAPNEFLLVIGPNGAGKSTLLRTIAGFVRPSRGSIMLDGSPIARKRPEVLARRGLRLVLEGHRVFPELSVADNLALAKLSLADRSSFAKRLEAAFDLFPVLAEREHQPAQDLSGGQQQFLALAQAFISNPRVLLCDEPSRGVALGFVRPILDFLRGVANTGVAVIVVEQVVDAALPFADRVLVLGQGRIIAEGTPDQFDQARLRELFLGV